MHLKEHIYNLLHLQIMVHVYMMVYIVEEFIFYGIQNQHLKFKFLRDIY